MIPALSPLLNLLAPKAAVPVAGDPAAFDLLLAGAGEAASGRQPATPTGKPVPPVVALVPMAVGTPVLPVDEPGADATLPVSPAKPASTISKITGWPRFAQPETCAEPAMVGEPPAATDMVERAAPEAPAEQVLATERDLPAVRTPVVEMLDQGSAARAEATPVPDIPSRPAEPSTATAPAPKRLARVEIGDAGQHEPVARLGDDQPRPMIEASPVSPPPLPFAPVSMAVSAHVPVAPAVPLPGPDRNVPAIAAAITSAPETGAPKPRTDPRVDPAPPPRIPATIGTADATAPDPRGPIDRLDDFPLTSDRTAPRATAPVRLPGEPVIVAPTPARPRPEMIAEFGATPARPSLDAPRPVATAAPLRFAGSPFRPLLETEPPVAGSVGPVAPLSPSIPSPAVSATASAVAGPAVTTVPPPVNSPVEQAPELVIPSDPRPDTPDAAAPDRLPATPIATGTIAPAIARTVMSGSARQVFAADLRRPARDIRPVAGELLAAPVEAARLEMATAVATVPIDMRQDRWPSAMVDRIERLRDAVDAADTRIRLIPDALGSIDVAVKRDGDIVHVHFTAEQAATRALLQDAAPRLAEAAEARGLKLGQTVAGDGGSQPNGRQPQPNTAPARPRSAAAADEDATDPRIA